MASEPVAKTIGRISAYVLLAATAYLIWVGFQSLRQTTSEFWKIVLPSFAVFFAAIINVLANKKNDRRRQVEQELRSKKTPVYEEFTGFVFDLLFAEKLGRQKPEDLAQMQAIAKFTQGVIIWGSDNLLIELRKFRSAAISGNPNDLVFSVESLLLAIRKDLGHENRGLSKGSLLGTFVNDMDKHL